MCQLLATMRLYATGGHLSSVADFMGMDPSTVSRIVKRTTAAIAHLRNRYNQNGFKGCSLKCNYHLVSFHTKVACDTRHAS